MLPASPKAPPPTLALALTLAFSLLLSCAGCNAVARIMGTTVIGDTRDRIGPYPVLSQVDDPDGLDRVTLHVRPGVAGEAVLPMSELLHGVFRGLIPGQPPFTKVGYFVEAEDGDERVSDPPQARSGDLLVFWVIGTSCQQDIECGPGEYCDGQRVCRQRAGPCSVDADCGKGFRCGPLKTCLLAARACHHDEGCLLGEVCDRLLGQCTPRPRCGSGLSCPLEFSCDAATGLCWRGCLGPSDCGPGESCQGSRCSGAKPCQQAAACPSGLSCDPILHICRPEGAALCAPCNSDADCGGPTDYCLLLGSGQFCGSDCLSNPCPESYLCNTTVSPPQCQPVDGTCHP